MAASPEQQQAQALVAALRLIRLSADPEHFQGAIKEFARLTRVQAFNEVIDQLMSMRVTGSPYGEGWTPALVAVDHVVREMRDA